MIRNWYLNVSKKFAIFKDTLVCQYKVFQRLNDRCEALTVMRSAPLGGAVESSQNTTKKKRSCKTGGVAFNCGKAAAGRHVCVGVGADHRLQQGHRPAARQAAV